MGIFGMGWERLDEGGWDDGVGDGLWGCGGGNEGA